MILGNLEINEGGWWSNYKFWVECFEGKYFFVYIKLGEVLVE